MRHYDLNLRFQEDVNNLMVVVHKIIEAQEKNQDITVFMQELLKSYQMVKETQLQMEEFNNTVREVLGHVKTTDSNFC